VNGRAAPNAASKTMALDVKDWIEFGRKYAAGYAAWLHCALATPWKATPRLVDAPVGVVVDETEPKGVLARPVPVAADLAVVVAISIFLGATLGATIPGRPKFQDRATVLVVVCAIWLVLGWLIHMVCRLLRGQGSLAQSLTAIIQVMAAVYVVANVVTLVLVGSLRTYWPERSSDWLVVRDPGAALVLLQCFALLYYVPASLAAIHKFRRMSLVAVACFSGLCALVIFLPVAQAGGCAAPIDSTPVTSG